MELVELALGNVLIDRTYYDKLAEMTIFYNEVARTIEGHEHGPNKSPAEYLTLMLPSLINRMHAGFTETMQLMATLDAVIEIQEAAQNAAPGQGYWECIECGAMQQEEEPNNENRMGDGPYSCPQCGGSTFDYIVIVGEMQTHTPENN